MAERRLESQNSRLPAGRALAAAVTVCAATTGPAPGQDNPVYIDDSPRAWELFRLAQEQTAHNLGEAARLYQELLDDYPLKLIPIDDDAVDHFVSVQIRVLDELLSNERLTERYCALEDAEATRLLEAGALERLALTRPVTGPGLEGLLQLAQRDLESARFHSALDRVEQAMGHPDLTAERAAWCAYVGGLAAHYLDDGRRTREALDALRRMEPQVTGELAAELDRLTAATVAPVLEPGIDVLTRATASDLGELVAQPIWTVPLHDTPLGRSQDDPGASEPPTSRLLDQMRRTGSLLTTTPTVAGRAVFVNEGRVVHAVDRFTGRPLWPAWVDRPAVATDRGRRQIADLNFVTVRDGAVVTLTGHAFADTATADRRVVCLDAETGEVRWSIRVERLEGREEFDGLVPHGAPVIGEGIVYVLARKVSRQLLTSCYLLALDLADGSLLWAKHIASSGGIRARLARPFSSPVYVDGDVVVATAIGAVARIDGTTGRTRWLRRYHPPLSPYFPERRPWEIDGPVVTSGGVIAIRPDHQRVVLLDWERGDELQTISATGSDAWHAPRYLVEDGHAVFAVGREIRAFSLEQLEEPLWRFPDVRRPPEARFDYDPDRVDLRGRVQLVEDLLAVPTNQGLFFIDAETGRIEHRLDVELPGNPLASGPQMVVASGDSLLAYMPFGRAEQMLRQQIAAAPDDPAPALALARLGVRARDLSLALEVTDQVISAINRRSGRPGLGRARQELVEILLELDQLGLAQTREQGAMLHAKIGLVALEPEQRVEHLLAQGDWLRGHALGQAVEAYQMILSTPELAAARRTSGAITRPGWAWAAQRIAELIDVNGHGVYQPQAELAGLSLRSVGAQDTAALLALAREYPFADSAAEAALQAARTLAQRGAPREAVAALAGLYRMVPSAQRASVLLAAAAEISLEAGWPAHAGRMLRFVRAAHGDLPMASPRGETVTAWLDTIGATGPRRPRVGEFAGTALTLEGVLVPLARGAEAPVDRALLWDPPDLLLMAGSMDRPLWTSPIALPGSPRLLRFTDEEVLLWYAGGAGAQAVMLDGRDGVVRWTTPPFGRSGRDALLQPDGGDDPPEVLPLVGPETLLLLRVTGEVRALNLADGRTERWERRNPPAIASVSTAVVDELGIVLAGTRRNESAEIRPGIVVLDGADGRTIATVEPQTDAEISWVAIGPLGSIVYATPLGIEAVDLFTGSLLFANTSARAQHTSAGWMVSTHVVVEGLAMGLTEGPNPLRAVNLADGSVSEPFDPPIGGEWERVEFEDLIVDDGRVFAHYGQRIVRYDPTGAVLGADMISDQRDYRWLFVTDDRLVLVSRFDRKVVQAEAGGRQAQNYYRLYTLSLNGKLIGDESHRLDPVNQRLQQARLIDGWLLLSSTSETIAVPVPIPE